MILFLVEEVQTSKLSHRTIEHELWNRLRQWIVVDSWSCCISWGKYKGTFLSPICLCRNIPVIRRRFVEVQQRGSLDGDKRLFMWVSLHFVKAVRCEIEFWMRGLGSWCNSVRWDDVDTTQTPEANSKYRTIGAGGCHGYWNWAG